MIAPVIRCEIDLILREFRSVDHPLRREELMQRLVRALGVLYDEIERFEIQAGMFQKQPGVRSPKLLGAEF